MPVLWIVRSYPPDNSVVRALATYPPARGVTTISARDVMALGLLLCVAFLVSCVWRGWTGWREGRQGARIRDSGADLPPYDPAVDQWL